MAFDSYDGGYGSSDYDNYDFSYLEDPTQDFNYNYDPSQYDYQAESDYYGQPAYQDDYSYDVAPEQYIPPASMYEPEQPGLLSRFGKAAGDYAANNPKDVLGMAAGAGMGLWGLLRGTEHVQPPDTRDLDAAKQQLSQQIAQMQGLNADAQARMQKLIAGDYGDFQDEAQLRQTVNQQLQDLIARGPGGRTPQEEEQLAQIDQEYAAKNLLGSSLHQKARQAALDAMNTSSQGRYLAEMQGLQNLGTAKANTQRGVYSDTAGMVGQQQNTQIQGLGTLANAGLATAKLGYDANKANSDIENSRSQQLLQTGGQIFGQSMAPNYSDLLYPKKKITDTTGVRL